MCSEVLEDPVLPQKEFYNSSSPRILQIQVQGLSLPQRFAWTDLKIYQESLTLKLGATSFGYTT